MAIAPVSLSACSHVSKLVCLRFFHFAFLCIFDKRIGHRFLGVVRPFDVDLRHWHRPSGKWRVVICFCVELIRRNDFTGNLLLFVSSLLSWTPIRDSAMTSQSHILQWLTRHESQDIWKQSGCLRPELGLLRPQSLRNLEVVDVFVDSAKVTFPNV